MLQDRENRPTESNHLKSQSRSKKSGVWDYSAGNEVGRNPALRVTVKRRVYQVEDDDQQFHVRRSKRNFFVPLKNNREVDLRDIKALMGVLRSLQKDQPANFKTLFLIAHGRTDGVSPQSTKDLKHWGFLGRDGAIKEDVRELLLLAGTKLEEPYRVDSINDQLTLALANEEIEDVFRKRIEDLLKPDKPNDGKKKGRTP